MKMKKPELTVVRFASEDVIATSVYYDVANNKVYFDASMYGMPDENNSWYVGAYFSDTITPGSDDIYNPEYVKSQVQGGSSYVYGQSVDQIYDAYVGDDGYLHTKGASYYDLYYNNNQ